jgi:hypothetical protein
LSEEPPRHRVGMSWLVYGVVGLAALAVLAVFVPTGDEVAFRAADPVAPTAPAARTAAVPEPVPPPPAETPSAGRLAGTARNSAAETVLVPAAEREAFRRFLRTVSENGFAYSVPDTSDDAPLSVAEITIEPIVIAPMDASAE